MASHSVTITGTPLAFLLSTLVTSERDIDGFIVGRHVTKTVSTMQDYDGDESSQVMEVHIRGFLHNSGVGTFYSYGGTVDEGKLREATAGSDDAILGWFVARQMTGLAPTMRDQAVSASMAQALKALRQNPPGAPLLFLIAAWGHDDAAFTAQHRLYQLPGATKGGASPKLQPVPFRVVNMGPWRSRGAYEPLAVPFVSPLAIAEAGDGTARDGGGGVGRGVSDGDEGGASREIEGLLSGGELGRFLGQIRDMDAMYAAAVQRVKLLYNAEDGVRADRMLALQTEVQTLLAGL